MPDISKTTVLHQRLQKAAIVPLTNNNLPPDGSGKPPFSEISVANPPAVINPRGD